MSKQEALNLMILLHLLESWSFSTGAKIPDYLLEGIDEAKDVLSEIVEECYKAEIYTRKKEVLERSSNLASPIVKSPLLIAHLESYVAEQSHMRDMAANKCEGLFDAEAYVLR
jgi:hypothetical protein